MTPGMTPNFSLSMRTNRPDSPSAGVAMRGEVQAGLFGHFIHPAAHIADDLQAQVLGLLRLPVVLADEGLEALRQADKAHRQGAVLENLAHRLVHVQLVGVQPHALAHEEGIVADLFGGLDLKRSRSWSMTRSIFRSSSSKKVSMLPLALMAKRGRLMEVKLRLPRP